MMDDLPGSLFDANRTQLGTSNNPMQGRSEHWGERGREGRQTHDTKKTRIDDPCDADPMGWMVPTSCLMIRFITALGKVVTTLEALRGLVVDALEEGEEEEGEDPG